MRLSHWYATAGGWFLLLAGCIWALKQEPVSAMICFGAALVLFVWNIIDVVRSYR